MQIDRERLALAILNGDRVAGGWPRIETRTHVPHSEGYLRNIDDVLADIEAQGFVVVPREPTEAMVRSGGAAFDYPSLYMGGSSESGKRKAKSIWSTMIDAGKGEG